MRQDQYCSPFFFLKETQKQHTVCPYETKTLQVPCQQEYLQLAAREALESQVEAQ